MSTEENVDVDALADDVLERLDPGTVIDNKVILSRRQLIAIAGTGVGAGALAALGVDGATAQSAVGQLGTEGSPLNAYLRDDYKVQQSSTPSAPPSGYLNTYAKDDQNLYKQLPDGTEQQLGGVDGKDIAPSSVSTDDAEIGTRWGTADPQTAAPLASTGDIDLYVSPSGDNSNDGLSSGSPVADPYHGFAQIPKQIYHNVTVHLDYGTYSRGSGEPFQLQSHLITPRNNNGLTILGHDSANFYYNSNNSVQDIVFDGDFFISGCVGSEESPEIIGVTFDPRLQVYDSRVLLRDCRFETGAGALNQMLGGHGGKVVAIGCNFVGTGSELGVYTDNLAQMYLAECTASSLANSIEINQSIAHVKDDNGLMDFAPAAIDQGALYGSQYGISQTATGGFVTGGDIEIDNRQGDNSMEFDIRTNGNLQFRMNYVDSQNRIDFREGFDTRMSLDLSTGDLSIEGSLNENASL